VREGHLSWLALMPPEHRLALEELLRRLRTQGTLHAFEGELARENGSRVPVLLGSALLDEERQVTFALDLSDWKPSEAPLQREADARLHDLIALAPVVLFSLDRDGVFTLSEGHGLKPLGFKPGQVVGMSVFDLYRAEPTLLSHVRRALAGEEFSSVDVLSTGLCYEIYWVPLRDPEGRLAGTLGLAVDVTQREREARWRAQLFVEAEEARAEAERAVGLRDEFLSVASHELKTPLTSLNLQLQVLHKRARQGPDAELVQRLERAQRQLQKLARMMDELLDVSRLAEGRLRLELSEVDLVQVVREVLERFQEEAQRTGTRLELRGGAEPVVGRWDRAKLERVVTNLVSNALKYGEGAPVDLEVGSSGAMGLLEVMDRGIGIAPEDLGRIFGKFERAVPVRQYGGFGLGLYIVRQLVEALGGAVDVESIPGHGATFHIILPLAGPEARSASPPPSPPDLH